MYIFDFGQIQYFYKVLKTDFEIQYFQYRVGTLPTLLMASLIKKQYPKPKNFFSLQTKRLARSPEGLNSSIVQSVKELCS